MLVLSTSQFDPQGASPILSAECYALTIIVVPVLCENRLPSGSRHSSGDQKREVDEVLV